MPSAIPGTGTARMSSPPSMPRGGSMPPAPGGKATDLGGSGPITVVWQGLPVVISLPMKMQGRIRVARDRALERLQSDLVEWAQQNAPWQDRTGDARAELHSPTIEASPNGDRTVILAHGVEYGIHLETMDGGALGIIARAIDEFSGKFPDYMAEELGAL